MAEICDKLAEEMGQQPLSSPNIAIEDGKIEHLNNDKRIVRDAAAEEARASRQDMQERTIEPGGRTEIFRQEDRHALRPGRQAFTRDWSKKVDRDGLDRENQGEDVKEDENQMTLRHRMSSAQALAYMYAHNSKLGMSGLLGEDEGEEEFPSSMTDRILQPLREREMTGDTQSKEREATMTDQ